MRALASVFLVGAAFLNFTGAVRGIDRVTWEGEVRGDYRAKWAIVITRPRGSRPGSPKV